MVSTNEDKITHCHASWYLKVGIGLGLPNTTRLGN